LDSSVAFHLKVIITNIWQKSQKT